MVVLTINRNPFAEWQFGYSPLEKKIIPPYLGEKIGDQYGIEEYEFNEPIVKCISVRCRIDEPYKNIYIYDVFIYSYLKFIEKGNLLYNTLPPIVLYSLDVKRDGDGNEKKVNYKIHLVLIYDGYDRARQVHMFRAFKVDSENRLVEIKCEPKTYKIFLKSVRDINNGELSTRLVQLPDIFGIAKEINVHGRSLFKILHIIKLFAFEYERVTGFIDTDGMYERILLDYSLEDGNYLLPIYRDNKRKIVITKNLERIFGVAFIHKYFSINYEEFTEIDKFLEYFYDKYGKKIEGNNRIFYTLLYNKKKGDFVIIYLPVPEYFKKFLEKIKSLYSVSDNDIRKVLKKLSLMDIDFLVKNTLLVDVNDSRIEVSKYSLLTPKKEYISEIEKNIKRKLHAIIYEIIENADSVIERIVKEYGDEHITLQDSMNAGNCDIGTMSFAKKYGFSENNLPTVKQLYEIMKQDTTYSFSIRRVLLHKYVLNNKEDV